MKTTLMTMLAICLTVVALGAQASPNSVARTVWSGVYSKQQAQRGRQLYGRQCASCHSPSLQGSGEAPGLVGGDFAVNWDGKTVAELSERIRVSMPGNDPGSLTAQQTIDIVAFMLSAAKMPDGSRELPPAQEELSRVLFKAKQP